MANTVPSAWDYKDTLRQMTSKFNLAVQAIQELQESTQEVNEATIDQINDIQNSFNNELETIKNDLKSKIDSVTAEDLNLGNVDNTSDLDKPVSNATREAIQEATKNMATTEETSNEEFKAENLYDPQVTNPIKKYIEDRVTELFNAYQAGLYEPSYNVATSERLGVIKSGDLIQVNPSTGKLEIPTLESIQADLTTIKANITNISESLRTNNSITSQLEYSQGKLDELATIDKSSLVNAINELVGKISELVEGQPKEGGD